MFATGGGGAACAEESSAGRSSVRSEAPALDDLEVVVTSACSAVSCSAAASVDDSVASVSDDCVARVERRLLDAADARSNDASVAASTSEDSDRSTDASEGATASEVSNEEPRVGRESSFLDEPDTRSREESDNPDRCPGEFVVSRDASRAGSEVDSREEVTARGPSAEWPDELLSLLSA